MTALKNRVWLRIALVLLVTAGFSASAAAYGKGWNQCIVNEGCESGCFIVAVDCPSCQGHSDCTITWDAADNAQCAAGFMCQHSCPICETWMN